MKNKNTYVLISAFSGDFPKNFAKRINEIITNRSCFVMIAADFCGDFQKTDYYLTYFREMFARAGVSFRSAFVIDARMSKEQAKETLKMADVAWLAGGDTPTQYKYLNEYDLINPLQSHNGVVFGMSAGAINMSKTAICTLTCKHEKFSIYNGLGLVDISVEPHFDKTSVSTELTEISKEHTLYGLCDESAVVCRNGEIEFLGDVFLLSKGMIKQIS